MKYENAQIRKPEYLMLLLLERGVEVECQAKYDDIELKTESWKA